MTFKSTILLVLKYIALVAIYMLVSSLSSILLPEKLVMAVSSDPSTAFSLLLRSLFVAAVNAFIITVVILRSRWSGWKLALGLSVAYYGVVTFMSQIETGYFAESLGVDGETLVRLFLTGLPVALIFIPLAVWIWGKARSKAADIQITSNLPVNVKEWVWKLGLIAVLYAVVYFTFGYFVAWQNPSLVDMYDAASHPQVFNNARLVPFQLLRGVLWGLLAVLLLHILRGNNREKAILVGVMFAVPMSIGLIFPNNPFMPDASVRMSHLVELLSSNSLFGILSVVILTYRSTTQREPIAQPKEQTF
jgi:hypothetical protein